MADSIVRRVRFTTEEHLDAVPLSIRADGQTLAPGAKIQVEVGGRWIWDKGTRKRIEGQWVDCIIVAETSRDLLVQLVRS